MVLEFFLCYWYDLVAENAVRFFLGVEVKTVQLEITKNIFVLEDSTDILRLLCTGFNQVYRLSILHSVSLSLLAYLPLKVAR